MHLDRGEGWLPLLRKTIKNDVHGMTLQYIPGTAFEMMSATMKARMVERMSMSMSVNGRADVEAAGL